MLSYQHAYHAGNKADIQKHSLLVRVLEAMTRDEAPLTFMETHSGRGIYDLTSPEALKTGEASKGWLEMDGAALAELPPAFVACVRALNGGALSPLYPGSPVVAAHVLRPQDQLRLMELHPQEYDALKVAMKNDSRAQVQKRDGLEGVWSLVPSTPRKGLVLIDPSYEIKEDYEEIPEYAEALAKAWQGVCILIWIPMLPAKRHEGMVETLKSAFPAVKIFQTEWDRGERGMYGSIMAGINLPPGI